MVFWVHPVWQAAATCGALFVLFLGWQRFCILHFRGKGTFAWKRHVFLGKIVLGLWCAGAILGIVVARLEWGVSFITGTHMEIGLWFVPLAAVGYLTGSRLDKVKKRRLWLPLLHGATNTLLIALAATQAWTGWFFLP